MAKFFIARYTTNKPLIRKSLVQKIVFDDDNLVIIFQGWEDGIPFLNLCEWHYEDCNDYNREVTNLKPQL